MSRRWNTAQLLRSVEEAHIDRSTRLGLADSSRLSPESSSSPIFETSSQVDADFPYEEFREPIHPICQILRASRRGRYHDHGEGMDATMNAAATTTSTDMDVFHDCVNLEEENAAFSTIFDDLDLEGPEMLLPRPSPNTSLRSSPSSGPAASPSIDHHEEPAMYNSGNGSRGSSCKRKSCNLPPASNSPMRLGGGDGSPQGDVVIVDDEDAGVHLNHHQQLLLGPSSGGGGASSSSSSASRLVEGPRPQKTRLSSDAVDPVFGTPVVFGDSAGSSSGGGSGGTYHGDFRLEESSPGYPRSVRRTFYHGEPRGRPLENPDLNMTFTGELAPLPDSPPPLAVLRSSRTPSPRGTPLPSAGQGITRRFVGRSSGSSSSSRGGFAGSSGGAAGPSMPQREPGESRMRSIRMACLESSPLNGPSSLRRGVANYFPGLGGGIPGRHANAGETRQQGTTGYHGRGSFPRPSPSGVPASVGFPSGSLLDETTFPDMRLPSAFLENGVGPRAFRPVLRELATGEGFHPSPDFEWERHRPRLMAGGLAEILRALERVDRDEDLTREQLLMLEATTFLFGGIGLHDDHNDWRLDIDNMSYEELLALGDRIGTVSTGVSEDVIAHKLRKSLYTTCSAKYAKNLIMEDYDVKCCVCQEEYESGVELGTIDCGHSYHTDCIRQWLVRKNSCPICKATALSPSPAIASQELDNAP